MISDLELPKVAVDLDDSVKGEGLPSSDFRCARSGARVEFQNVTPARKEAFVPEWRQTSEI